MEHQTAKETINELEALETIQNETQRKEFLKMKRASESCGTTLNTLIFMSLESLKRNGIQNKQRPKFSKFVKN